MRLEPDPHDADTTVLVDEAASTRASRLLTADVAAVAAMAALAAITTRFGAAGLFVTVFGFLLLGFLVARQQLPSTRPLAMDDEGLTIRIVGAGLRVHWDAVEGMDARPEHPLRLWRTGASTPTVALTFRLRPGASAQGLVKPRGWRSGWMTWQDSAAVRRVPAYMTNEVLGTAAALHRKRLSETSRLGPALPNVPRYPG